MAEIFDPKPVVQKGFEIEERIILTDRRTGKTWR